MADKYDAKEYSDAIASEIDEAAKASLEATRSIIEIIQNALAESSEYEDREEKTFPLINAVMQLVPSAVSLELATNNIERMLNIMNMTACLKGLDEREALVIDKTGFSLFNYYTPFVDDSYILLDYYEENIAPEKLSENFEGILETLRTIAEKNMVKYGNIVVRRKGREK